MILLGMTGPIGHGKTTLAQALTKVVPGAEHIESSQIIAQVANAWQATLKQPIETDDIYALNQWIKTLPDVLSDELQINCTYDQLEIDEKKHELADYQKLITHVQNVRQDFSMATRRINPDNKELYRPLLQWLGGYLVRHASSDIWYDEIVRLANIKKANGSELCIVGGLRFPRDAEILRRNDGVIISVIRPGYVQYDINDPTERERRNIQVDSTISSNGGVDDLIAFAPKLWADLQAGTLEPNYTTA